MAIPREGPLTSNYKNFTLKFHKYGFIFHMASSSPCFLFVDKIISVVSDG